MKKPNYLMFIACVVSLFSTNDLQAQNKQMTEPEINPKHKLHVQEHYGIGYPESNSATVINMGPTIENMTSISNDQYVSQAFGFKGESFILHDIGHTDRSVEQDANARALRHFINKYGEEFASDGRWNHEKNSIIGYNQFLSYNHVLNQQSLHSAIKKRSLLDKGIFWLQGYDLAYHFYLK